MGAVTTTLVSGQSATLGAVSTASEYTVSVSSGVAGTNGVNGVSVANLSYVNNNLLVTLSNSAIINAGSITISSITNNNYTVSLAANATLVLPGNNALVYSNNGVDLKAATGKHVKLQSSNSNNSIWVDDSGAYIKVDSGNNSYQWTFANVSLKVPDAGMIEANGSQWSYLDLTYLDSTLAANQDVRIYANESNNSPAHWIFRSNTAFEFPDNTLQLTAFNTDRQYNWSNTQTFTGTININGNLNVNGNTNYFTSNNIVYTDSMIEIHAPGGNTANVWSTDDGSDIGFRFHYYNGGDKNAALFMDNSTWRLKWVSEGAELANGQFDHTGNLGDIQANTFYGTLSGTANNANYLGGTIASSYLTTNSDTAISTGNVSVNGQVTVTGNVSTNNISVTNNVTVTGNVSTNNISVTNHVTVTGNILGNTSTTLGGQGYPIGYRDIPQVLANTSTTIADNQYNGKHFYCANSTSMTLTIANNTTAGGTVPIGSAIGVVSYGTGNVVVSRATGVSLYLVANNTSADRTIATFGMATLLKVADDTWFISGSGVT